MVRRLMRRMPVAAGAITAAALAVAWRFFTFTGFNNDHYVHVARANQILLGDWPIRDFEDPGMPLMYAVSAAGRLMFGPELRVEWAVVTVAYAVAAGCFVWGAARLGASAALGLGAATLGLLLNPRSFSYPKYLLYAAAALVIIAAVRMPTRGRIAGLAAISAVAFLFRHDHGLFIGWGSAAALLLASGRDVRLAARRLGELAVWLAVFLGPWMVYVQLYTGLGNYFATGVAFSAAEARTSDLKGFPSFVGAIASPGNAWTWLFYLFHAIPIVILVLAWRSRRDPEVWRGERSAVCALALMAIPVNLSLMRFPLDGRVPDAFILPALLGTWLLTSVWRRHSRTASMLALRVVSLMLVAVTAAAVAYAADLRQELGRAGVFGGVREMRLRAGDLWDRLGKRIPERDHVPGRYARGMLPFLQYVTRCTTRDDRLLMTGLFPEVYVIADRGFAAGHQSFRREFYTAPPERMLTLARLRRQSVPFVVMVRANEADLRAAMPELSEHLTTGYSALAHIPVSETPGVDVYVDRFRPSVRRDPDTGWPCFT